MLAILSRRTCFLKSNSYYDKYYQILNPKLESPKCTQVPPAASNREEDPEAVVAQLIERLLSVVAPPEELAASNAALPGPAVRHFRDSAAAASVSMSQELPSTSEAPDTDMEDAGSPAASIFLLWFDHCFESFNIWPRHWQPVPAKQACITETYCFAVNICYLT